MIIEPEKDDIVIVLVGNFNPSIIHPAWLELHNLVGSNEAKDAALDFTTPDLSQFRAANLSFIVETRRFVVRCQAIHLERIRDFVTQCFGTILNHTPISALGINRDVHFNCKNFDTRNQLGRLLAPTDPWGEFGKQIEVTSEDGTEHGGLLRLTMKQHPRVDGIKGHIQAEVQPTPDTPDKPDNRGVIVTVNDHYDTKVRDIAQNATRAIEILNAEWETSIGMAEGIINNIMTHAKELER